MPHRGVSVGRSGHRFTPYANSESVGLKPTFSCSQFICPPSILVSSPEESPCDTQTDSPCTVSSAATLVNSTFDSDLHDIECPSPLSSNPSCKAGDNSKQQQVFHQKRVDYISQLIDYTCEYLNDVWPTEGIPAVFRYRHGANFGYSSDTVASPLEAFRPHSVDTDLIPLQKFVREILRRSRSTCSTFQTALCYLEAIRAKIPSVQQAEKAGRGCRGDQVDNEGRIEYECFCAAVESQAPSASCHLCQALNDASQLRKIPASPPFPLPALPSALLCPRRAFMGALVLSAKFVQDKAYSNRAWAKLCGLPAREVGRCERAVGDALDWRLWVGRDKQFALSGLEHKLGRAPTMMDACIAVEDRDRKDIAVEPLATSLTAPLGRSKTWPVIETTLSPISTVLATPAESFSFSPAPSLCYSTSSQPFSDISSPFFPSPRPLFVANNPSPFDSKQHSFAHNRLRTFLRQQALGKCSEMVALQDGEDAFAMRGGMTRVEVV